jgi:hypothetical protein
MKEHGKGEYIKMNGKPSREVTYIVIDHAAGCTAGGTFVLLSFTFRREACHGGFCVPLKDMLDLLSKDCSKTRTKCQLRWLLEFETEKGHSTPLERARAAVIPSSTGASNNTLLFQVSKKVKVKLLLK